jgi:hypothetical protein
MKHMKVLSNEKPAEAIETAWVQFKNVFGTLPLTANQALWVNSQIDQKLR